MTLPVDPHEDLFASARAAELAPTLADRERVRGRLAVRLAAGTVAFAGASQVARAATWRTLAFAGKLLLPIVVTGVTAAVAYSWRERPRSHDLEITHAAAAPSVDPLPALHDENSPAEAADAPKDLRKRSWQRPAPRTDVTPSSATDNAPATDSKQAQARASAAAELAQLRKAQAALARGDGARALVELDTHDRQYPRGIFGQESAAARVLALCNVGRTAEARERATRFFASYPTSPLTARLRASCAGGAR